MGLGFRVVGFGAGAILASQDSIAVVFCGQDFGVIDFTCKPPKP